MNKLNKRIYLSPPHLTGQEMHNLQSVFSSNWVAPVGPEIDAFEQELGDLIKTLGVVATNSGTSAIHLALLALGVGKGDEVVCSTFTFCASANPIVYCDATPVFVDSESESWNMDPALLEEAIMDRSRRKGRRPKAIVLVHLYGVPARVSEIMAIADKYAIPVIEDAAEALGSTYHGRQVGTFGAVGILSFNGNKIITSSAGGALFSSDSRIVEQARYFRQEAREPVSHYEHKAIGYNYRMSNLLASVGRSQLKALNNRVESRCLIFKCYQQAFESFSLAEFQLEPDDSRSNRWLTVVNLAGGEQRADAVKEALTRADIESRRAWKPMHLQPVFKDAPCYVNGVSERVFSNALCLPSGSSMSNEDVDRVVAVIKVALDRDAG